MAQLGRQLVEVYMAEVGAAVDITGAMTRPPIGRKHVNPPLFCGNFAVYRLFENYLACEGLTHSLQESRVHVYILCSCYTVHPGGSWSTTTVEIWSTRMNGPSAS